MHYETLTYEIDREIATVTLNRPDKLNAFTMKMGREIVAAFREADRDPDVRCVILTGAGRAFCAGLDLAAVAEESKEAERSAAHRPQSPPPTDQTMLAFPHLVRAMRKPSIAAINGYALGVGITMCLPCDIRVIAEDAQVGFIFARVGLMAELGSTYFLPRLVGASRAAEMMLTGRRYKAQECLAMGLVSTVAPTGQALSKAQAIAAEIAEGSPMSVELTRQALFQGLDGTLDHAMTFENFALEKCSRSAEHKEYVSAFIEKRKPDLSRIRR